MRKKKKSDAYEMTGAQKSHEYEMTEEENVMRTR